MKSYDPWAKEKESYKARYFKQVVEAFVEAKQFIGKMRSRQGGVWFRRKCDTIFLEGI
jgi:hypothetical protein